MSSRKSFHLQLELNRNGFEESDFVRPEPPRRPMSWRILRPVLLQSAGAIGLAATIMVVIAGTAQLGDRDEAAEKPAVAATIDKPDAAPAKLVAAFAPAEAADDPGPRIVGSLPAPKAAPAADEVVAKPAASSQNPVLAKAAPQPVNAPAPASTLAAAAADALIAGSAHAVTEEAPAVQASAFWPKEAADCPRDWNSGSGLRPLGAECGKTATPSTSDVAMRAAAEQATAPEAKQATAPASKPAAKVAAVAPKARPAEASTTKKIEPKAEAKTETKEAPAKKASKSAQRPSDPPPNCGAGKRARWKFIEGEPTWYCKEA